MQSQKLKSLLGSILLVAILAALSYYFNTRRAETSSNTAQQEEREYRHDRKSVETRDVSTQQNSSVGFASRQKLAQHFQKHGREFGNASLEQYLRIAQTLRDKSVGSDVLEFVRPDGIVSRFEKSTGTFVAFNHDKTIRTCFRPNDGLAYFERQKFKDH
jgi:pyocin large subunit-like protein